jgi:predicted DNA-binding protein (MmcQ/YjbR family)
MSTERTHEEGLRIPGYAAMREFALRFPEAWEDFPFGADTAVMKIKNKMFATLSLNNGIGASNLKCDPDEALILREFFASVKPGYHMNKRHWNTVVLDGSVPAAEIERMMDRSYGLVVKGLKKVQRETLLLAYGEEDIYR